MSSSEGQPGFLERADKAGRTAENALIVIILSGMILLAAGQIFLRNLMGLGLPWADEALRLMVLWVAMVGAVAASREGRHIAIDVLSKVLPETTRPWILLVVNGFTAVVSLTVAWYAWVFVADSYMFEDRLLEDLPAWIFQAVLPAGFLLIGYRYTVWFLRSLRTIVSGPGRP